MNNQYILKKYLPILFFSGVILLFLMGFELSSGEKENDIQILKTPVFSMPSGFYEKELALEIYSDADVYYTLDGSKPDKDSTKYMGEILIENASMHKNYYSMITDVSTGFKTDLIASYSSEEDPQYRAPDYLVDKCTILRAVAIDAYGNRSAEVQASYFVGISSDLYDGCNIVSLISDPENFFGYENGIYVTGKRFEDYYEKGNLGKSWRFWESNYTQRGKIWERDAFINVFNEEGEHILAQNVGVRIHGGVSRGTLPKSLNLYGKDVDGMKSALRYDFFNNSYEPYSITLTCGGNQLITQFNDYMMTERVSSLNISTTKFEPYVLFINGEYWGFYWLSEKYDEHYFSFYYDVSAADVVMIKNGEIELGTDQDYRMYHDMRNFITLMDMSKKECYEQACELIDIESFIDYYGTMLYIGRYKDWPLSNFALWRTRSDNGPDYSDGRWRWILFDCNSPSMTKDLVKDDNLLMLLKSEPLFRSLWENDEFRQKFMQRLQDIKKECFNADEMSVFIDNYIEDMHPILEKSWKRFYGFQNDKETEFLETLESNRIFFNGRPKIIEEIIQKYR